MQVKVFAHEQVRLQTAEMVLTGYCSPGQQFDRAPEIIHGALHTQRGESTKLPAVLQCFKDADVRGVFALVMSPSLSGARSRYHNREHLASPLAVYCQTVAWLQVVQPPVNSVSAGQTDTRAPKELHQLLSECGSCLFVSAAAHPECLSHVGKVLIIIKLHV